MKATTILLGMKRITRFMAIAIISSLLFSCHGNTSDKDNKSTTIAKDTVTSCISIALLPTTDCLPFYVAEKMGFFDSLNVHVRLKTYQAAMDADTAFRNSTADACVTDLVKLNHWLTQGDSVCVILTADLQLNLVTATQARINSSDGLKEKIIAVTRNSALDFMADQVLMQAHLGTDKLNRPQINDIVLRMEMVNQNQYDGAFLPAPYAAMAQSKGAKSISTLKDLKAQSMLVLAVKSATARKHTKELQRLVQAYDAAVRYINRTRKDKPADLVKFIPLRCSIPDSLVEIPTFRYATDSIPQGLEDSVVTWIGRRGLLHSKPFITTLKDHTVKSTK